MESLAINEYSLFHQNHKELMEEKKEDHTRFKLDSIKSYLNSQDKLELENKYSSNSYKFMNVYDNVGLLHFNLKEISFAF